MTSSTSLQDYFWSALTELTLPKTVYWCTLASDGRTFLNPCVNYLSTIGKEEDLCPINEVVHGTKANDLLQLDYI